MHFFELYAEIRAVSKTSFWLSIRTNGNIVLNGGTITVEAGSAFDADGAVAFNAGDVTVNGTKVTQITSLQGMGGGKTRR